LYLPLFGSHDVDAMLWLLDDQPDRVSAAVRAGNDLSGGDVDGWIGLTFADGKVASISFSLRSKESRQVTLLVGSEGSMTIDRNSVSVDGEDVSFEPSANPFVRQMEEFIGSIREGRQPSVPGSEGVRTMRVLDLARAASEQQANLEF
jgi:predicted dehydrogenase